MSTMIILWLQRMTFSLLNLKVLGIFLFLSTVNSKGQTGLQDEASTLTRRTKCCSLDIKLSRRPCTQRDYQSFCITMERIKRTSGPASVCSGCGSTHPSIHQKPQWWSTEFIKFIEDDDFGVSGHEL